MPSNITVSYSHDALKRLVGKNIALTGYGSFTSTVGIEYKDNLNQYGTQISKYTSQVGNNAATVYQYTYDDNGNITQINDSRNLSIFETEVIEKYV